MSQFLGFGNGSEAALVISSAVADSAVTGFANTGVSGNILASATSITTESTSGFSNGDLFIIHQSRGSGVGTWEILQVLTISGTTINLTSQTVNAYNDSGTTSGAGANQAQIYRLRLVPALTVTGSGTISNSLWDGNKGGIFAILCSGSVTVAGTISANQKGFGGGAGGAGILNGAQGEGSVGAGSSSSAGNGNGGGGGQAPGGNGASGGGGGNGTVGSDGGTPAGGGGGTLGTGGTTAGSVNLTSLTFGGGGGAGAASGADGSGSGGIGGGIIFIAGTTITITGTITSTGGNGTSGAGSTGGGGGAGAGGSILLKTLTATLGASLITANGGNGGGSGSTGANDHGGIGGAGGAGRIRVEACSKIGVSTTTPSASEAIGGNSWCGSVAAILG